MKDCTPNVGALVVSDDVQASDAALETLAARPEWNPVRSASLQETARLQTGAALTILDLQGRGPEGLDVLAAWACGGARAVIAFVSPGDVEAAAEAIRRGAVDVVPKPVEPKRLAAALERAQGLVAMNGARPAPLQSPLSHPEAFSELVTRDERMLDMLRYAEAIAASPMPVLITGETGTGKELLAKAIHEASGRPGRFVAVNAAGLDDALFSDTLFGHARGAYTSAEGRREGLISGAGEGTLFLDEVGDLGPASQTKLLRLAQDYEYYPLGSDELKRADVRILAATNRKSLRDQPGFRDDLYYRLNTHHVDLPPLRRRLDDLPLLVSHFLDKAAETLGKPRPTAPRELLDLLGAYGFPGNVRELESMIMDAVSRHSKHVLSLRSFQEHIGEMLETAPPCGSETPFATLDALPAMRECQRMLIEEAMRRAQGNQGVAARLLGLSRTGLNKALKRLPFQDRQNP